MDDGDAAAVMATAAGGDDEVGVVMAAWVGFGGGVAARGSGDRVDPVERRLFGVGRKTRRKSFPSAGNGDGGGRVVAGGGRDIWGRESIV
ncbi:hypothetical protein Tco_1015077 [Tanacetum coccineum]|uniref:Uncharacterized protein n=1 Tax=Tanacetum coccineum TaxID=301880 RepID=A0ABQ5FLK1_9ASTR